MAIATHASVAFDSGFAGKTVTSGSISLPADALVLLFVTAGTNGSSVVHTTPTNSGTGLTWTQVAVATPSGGTIYRTAAYWAKNASSQSVTITAAYTATGESWNAVIVNGHVLTGHDIASPVQGTIAGPSATTVNDLTTTALTVDNAGRLYAAWVDTTGYVDMGTSSDGTIVAQVGAYSDAGFAWKAVTAGSRTLNIDATGSAAIMAAWFTFAVKEATVGTTYDADITTTTTATQTTGTDITRAATSTATTTATATAGGALVSALAAITSTTTATLTAEASVTTGTAYTSSADTVTTVTMTTTAGVGHQGDPTTTTSAVALTTTTGLLAPSGAGMTVTVGLTVAASIVGAPGSSGRNIALTITEAPRAWTFTEAGS